jgi:hypothetical protein
MPGAPRFARSKGRAAAVQILRERSKAIGEERFLVEAQLRCPEQVGIFESLFDHVEAKGGSLSWGKVASPRVSGLYRIDRGKPQPVWTTRTGTGSASSRPHFYFYVNAIRDRTKAKTFAAFVTTLSAIPGLKDQLPPISGKDMPSVALSELTSLDIDTVLDALDLLLA